MDDDSTSSGGVATAAEAAGEESSGGSGGGAAVSSPPPTPPGADTDSAFLRKPLDEEELLKELEGAVSSLGLSDADVKKVCGGVCGAITKPTKEELADLCARMAEAVYTTRSKGKHTDRALAWARQGTLIDEFQPRAIFVEATIHEDTKWWGAAKKRYEDLAGLSVSTDNRTYIDQAKDKLIDDSVDGPSHFMKGYQNSEVELLRDLVDEKRLKKAIEEKDVTVGTDGKHTITVQSPAKIFKQITAGDEPLIEAMKSYTIAAGDTKKIKSAEKVVRARDTRGKQLPQSDGSILYRTWMARRGSTLNVLSWNAQLAKNLDGPNDTEIKKAIEDKSRNICGVMEQKSCSLLVIQEAPGPQMRERGGELSKDVANEKELQTTLLRCLPPGYLAESVALTDKRKDEGKKSKTEIETGEDHIFLYDPAVLRLESKPAALPTCDADAGTTHKLKTKKGWFGRAPSFAVFRVLKWGATGAEARLLVVSVHAKSGGKKETIDDVSMIARAVKQRQNELAEDGDGPELTVLVIGDFNLASHDVAAAFEAAGMVDFKPAFDTGHEPATNIWQFNGSGKKESEGHAYDSGFFHSKNPADSIVEGELVTPEDVSETNQHMIEVAGQVRSLLNGFLTSVRKPLNATSKSALTALLDDEGSANAVPLWLRKQFCKAVKLHWADHLPICMQLTMCCKE